MDKEELLTELEDIDYKIELLEKMYQHAIDLMDLNEEDFKLDTNFEEMRDEIDIRLSDLKEERDNIREDIRDFDANKRELEEYSYYRNHEL
jgi:hypothetical protein